LKRKQRNRVQIQNQKQAGNQLEHLINETKKFMNFLYFKDIDEFFEKENKPFHDKVNAYRLLLMFGFIYYKEENVWKTPYADITDPEEGQSFNMMNMLKGIVSVDKLVFEYRNESEE